jgi:hypothetical protein
MSTPPQSSTTIHNADYTAPQLTAAAAASVAALASMEPASDSKTAASSSSSAASSTASSAPLFPATDSIYLVGDSVLDNFIWLA